MDYSGIVDEIVVQCCTHLKTPVITQVQHVPFVGLAPVLVPVSPGTGDDRLPVPVIAGLGVLTDTICVQAHIVHHVVTKVEVMDLPIKPINLFLLIDVTRVRIWAVVGKPGKLWGEHEGGDGHCVWVIRVEVQTCQLHKISEPIEHVQDLLSETWLYFVHVREACTTICISA